MKVVLGDMAVVMSELPACVADAGQFKLRLPKSEDELKSDKTVYDEMKARGLNPRKPNRFKFEHHDMIAATPDGSFAFLPGLWPRVQQELDGAGIKYVLEDLRSQAIRPAPDYSALAGFEARPGQLEAMALLASSDCGIIKCPTAWGKCQRGDTPILMYSGECKRADEIVPGDLICGTDGSPRRVLNTCHGYGPMYKYTPVKGRPYYFNGAHQLSLRVSCKRPITIQGRRCVRGDIVDICIDDYLKLPRSVRHILKAYRSRAEFAPREAPELDPYFVGVYLGDGSRTGAFLANADPEILNYCELYAKSMDWLVTTKVYEGKNCYKQTYTHKPKSEAPVRIIHKFIMDTERSKIIHPDIKYGSYEVRCAVLAGLLDTDGYTYGGIMEISTKFDTLAEDILFVARSLGFYASDKYCEKCCTNTGAVGMYHRIKISGDFTVLPLRVPHKIPQTRISPKDVLNVGFTIERVDDGDYYGFAVDGDHRYLLGDCTVTHNSMVISKICRIYPTLNIVVTTSSSQVVGTLYDRIKQECPGEVGLICGTKNTAAGKRIICCTLRSLEKVNPEDIQLVLVDEVHGVGANQAGLVLSQFVFARRFGFSASPVRNDGSAKALEAIMGPVILDVSYADAVSSGMVVPLRYVMLPCNRGPEFLRDIVGADGVRHRKGIPDVFRKKFSYWRNSARNRQIASCVQRILEVDPDCQILVIVETLQHAVLLHQLIPNFLVAHYGASSMDELADDKKFSHIDLSRYMLKPKELDRIRGAFAKGTLRRVISTFVFRQGQWPCIKVLNCWKPKRNSAW